MKTMTHEELEQVYDKADPWSYQTNPADIERKKIILDIVNSYGPFERALDLGCGEGWITQDIQAKEIYGMEFSKQAISRWPKNIKKWNGDIGDFDLVLATGVLYENYDWWAFVNYMNEKGRKYIVTSNISNREFWKATESIQGELIQVQHFPYIRSEQEQFTQRLRVYKKNV